MEIKTTKYCPDCNTVRPLHEFSKSAKGKDGRQGKCKSCFRVYQMAHRYGLSLQRYHALVSHHQGKCGICDKEKPLVIDHNHETGRVRGLLCQECNKGLGLFFDSVEYIRAAEGYLIHG
jgi:hypothetical protein